MTVDDRGNTTIPALFAAAFLVGALWYLVGLADGMVFHEAMMDAADATSFAPSVVQARGMNVLALVNLVMSAILAILVAVKIVQLLLLAANVIACAIPFNPHCPLLSSWQSPFATFVRVADRTVSTVNRGLYASESAVAQVVPVAAQLKSRTAARQYSPVVESGMFASASLVPRDGRFGLPVEDEEYRSLCLHASEGVSDVAFKPLAFLPGASVIVQPILRYVGNLVGKVAKTFPSYFCGGGLGSGGFASLGDAFKDIAKQGIDKVAATACKEAVKAGASGGVPGAYGSPQSMASCTAGVTSSFSSISAGSSLGGAKQTSKRIFRPAQIGSDYFTSYGFVFSRYLEGTDVDRNMTVASWEKLPPAAAKSLLDRALLQTQVSKSELYFDPRAAGPKSWETMRDESLLHPRWRARLRKYRPPTNDVQGLFRGAGLSSILSTTTMAAGGVSPSFVVGLMLGEDPAALTSWADRNLGGPASPAGFGH